MQNENQQQSCDKVSEEYVEIVVQLTKLLTDTEEKQITTNSERGEQQLRQLIAELNDLNTRKHGLIVTIVGYNGERLRGRIKNGRFESNYEKGASVMFGVLDDVENTVDLTVNIEYEFAYDRLSGKFSYSEPFRHYGEGSVNSESELLLDESVRRSD